MGFFSDSFMENRRQEVCNLIKKIQYRIGDEWLDASTSVAEIKENSVVAKGIISQTATAQTITEIRILDGNNNIIGSQDMKMTTSTSRNKLILFECPIQEV